MGGIGQAPLAFRSAAWYIALADEIVSRAEFVKITKSALRFVKSATSQVAHFRQTAWFVDKFNHQGSNASGPKEQAPCSLPENPILFVVFF